MLIRVFFLIFLSYEVASQKNSLTNGSTEVDIFQGHPATDYFWATLNATENAFIEAWNLNARNVHSRKTLEDMWSSVDQTLKNPIGSQSWIRLSDHFNETLTHVVARDTLDKICTTIHVLLLRDSFKDLKEVYRQIEHKEEVNKKWSELAKLFFDEYKKINSSEKMRRNVAVIKTWTKQQIKDGLEPVKRVARQSKKPNKKRRNATK